MKKIIIIFIILSTLFGGYIITILQKISQPSIYTYGHLILSDRSGNIITKKGLSGGYMIPYTGSLEGELFNAIILTEDKRFMQHSGVDYKAKISGILENIKAGTIIRGGSTITEQYIKNRYYRGEKRTIKQKIDEAIAAIWIEHTLTKEEILRGYLDHIYFGNNIYGIESALELYFGGQRPEDLTRENILDIITRIRLPNTSRVNLSEGEEYRENVEKKLGWEVSGKGGLENTYIRQSIDLYPMITQRIMHAHDQYCQGKKEELQKWTYKIPNGICNSDSLVLSLSISSTLQEYTINTIETYISRIMKGNVTGGAVYIYNPTHQKVIAYVGNGGLVENDGEIDMIVRRRSVGSILKPFIYLLALRRGAEIDSLILDDSRIYPTGIDGKVFVPQNYNPKVYGPIKLKDALGNSLNSSTVRLSEYLGVREIYEFFKSIGLLMNHDAGYYGYGIALGAVELSLENIVESYSYLMRTTDPDIFLIYKTLSDPKNRAKTFGISSILGSSISLPVKTGTSTDFRDNWVVSYHQDAIVGVWVGNTNGSPMDNVSGVSGAGPIWHNIVEYMIEQGYIADMQYAIPRGVTETLICLDIRCSRKEKTYIKEVGTIKSRPLDYIYYKEDFVGVITEEEKIRWNIK